MAATSTRIPARGTTPTVFSLVRYTVTGQLDPTFGDGGKVLSQLSSNHLSAAAALAIQSDGKILVAGSTLTDHWWPIPNARYDFTVARYLADGRLGATFGSRGAAVHAVGTVSEDFAHAMTLQPDGKIVVVGGVSVRYPRDIGLLRLKADGGRDRSFGDGGKVVTQWEKGNSASSVAVQADGKILVPAAGIVLRYLPGGTSETRGSYRSRSEAISSCSPTARSCSPRSRGSPAICPIGASIRPLAAQASRRSARVTICGRAGPCSRPTARSSWRR